MGVVLELQPIILKFPDFKTKIVQLYYNDSNFKSLCDDYWLSSSLLQKYRSDVAAGLVLENEYGAICAILEEEMTVYLKKY